MQSAKTNQPKRTHRKNNQFNQLVNHLSQAKINAPPQPKQPSDLQFINNHTWLKEGKMYLPHPQLPTPN